MNHQSELTQEQPLSFTQRLTQDPWRFLLTIFSLFAAYYVISMVYPAAEGVFVHTRTIDYVFSPPANLASENIHLSIEYPTKVPLSPDTGFGQLRVQAWYDTSPISQSLTELPSNSRCNPPPFVPVDSKEDDLWLLLWSPSHSITLQLNDEEAKPPAFLLPINLSRACLSSPGNAPLLISLSKSSVQSPSQEQTGDLCIAVVTSTGQPIPLLVLQASPTMDTNNPISIHLQSNFAAAFRRFLERLLDSSFALDCVKLPAMLSLMALGFDAWNQERKRRQEEIKTLEDRIKTLSEQEDVPSWQEVWELRKRIYKEGYIPEWLRDLMDDYIRRRREAWIYEVRQWLGERFTNRCPDRELRVLVELHFLNEQQQSDLCAARERLQSPKAGPKERAEAALTILHNLGLAGLPYIEKQLKPYIEQIKEQLEGQPKKQQRSEPNPYRDMWEKDATGRYLWVRLTQDKNIYTGKDLTQPLRGLCCLWPLELVGETRGREAVSPFGPLKAEDDPRLGTHELFWDGHPAWEKATSYGHSGFLVPHGGGLSATILQGRRTFTLYGSTTALSVYLLIDAYVEPREAWLKRLHGALAESLLCALATDPVWFLAADEADGLGSTWQRELVTFLQIYSSDQNSTMQGFDGLRALLETRFPDPIPRAGKLLFERLSTLVVDTPPPLSWPLLYNVVKGSQRRLALYAMDNKPVPLFFWIEVQIHETQRRRTIARWLWDNRQLRDLGYIKLFVATDDTDEEEEAKEYNGDFALLQWTAEHLQALLGYRLRQAGTPVDEQRFISDFQRWLAQQGVAPETPQAYIRAGSHWLETQQSDENGKGAPKQ